MLHEVLDRFRAVVPGTATWSLRVVERRTQQLCVRRDVVQPPSQELQTGAMVSIGDGHGVGYAATSDLSLAGLREAVSRAEAWARQSDALGLGTGRIGEFSEAGVYQTPVAKGWDTLCLTSKLDLLRDTCDRIAAARAQARGGAQIVDWQASLGFRSEQMLLASSSGGCVEQRFCIINPGLMAVANNGDVTQIRTHGGEDHARQGGLEQLAEVEFPAAAQSVAEQALELVCAPRCANEAQADLLLMPSQMVLQMHESIGHPLELDRILGDERNYAGTSFVTPEMFGHYRYGSEHLNITFDPGLPEEVASYGFDDDGTKAERVHLIRQGVLQRALGGQHSQTRANVPGTAVSRACSWNRPTIDRMANLNMEPGTHSFEALVGSIESGVLMDTNRSWSIDDSRNKFQFGCEYARCIEDGELKHVVRDANYRGVSATFWRSLSHVGDRDTYRVLGLNTCGKGEPNQAIHVGHAAPACVFRKVAVFSDV